MEAYNVPIHKERYNSPKFYVNSFIIESYSEENIHKTSNMVFGLLLQMGTKHEDLLTKKLGKKLVDALSFFSSQWVSLSIR
jgi:hypothetical protein